ncbi:AzlD domain-containing protein [Cellulomonas sp. APG4]|uniref:AzlD domain-containing protein n=1 Tax=Cellulomonas sp. APG4 TaxID=1538656 RepID=UPI00137B0B17|nr:AzlD domain-containing protein [Cellulomonas sp. APG4]
MSAYAATWIAILAGAGLCFATKLVGHRLPEHWLAHPRVARVASLVTVALLAALVAVQAATSGRAVVVDARLAGLAAAAVALALRAPFVVVVLVAAVVAAGLRALT